MLGILGIAAARHLRFWRKRRGSEIFLLFLTRGKFLFVPNYLRLHRRLTSGIVLSYIFLFCTYSTSDARCHIALDLNECCSASPRVRTVRPFAPSDFSFVFVHSAEISRSVSTGLS